MVAVEAREQPLLILLPSTPSSRSV
jgi:hypothetical protein